VAVGLAGAGDYVIDAFSSVVCISEVTGSDEEILRTSFAKAWRVRTHGDEEPPVAVPPVVLSNGGYTAAVDPTTGMKDYDVVLGVAPEEGYVFFTDPPADITVRVIDRNVVVADDEDTVAAHYTVAANNAEIRSSEIDQYVGLDSKVTRARLIDRASAEAFRLTSGVENYAADVIANNIDPNAQPGESFDVTFAVKDMPSVTATVKFRVIAGNLPVLNTGGPLVLPMTAESHVLLANDLMDGVTAVDAEDGNLTNRVVLSGPGGDRLPVIDTAVPGIYSVQYTVSDSDDNTVKAGRSIVVTDGRHELIDEDGDGSVDVIIGARGYVVKHTNLLETDAEKLEQAKSLSGVEAFNATGANLASQLHLKLPKDYLAGKLGIYPLTWTVSGHPMVSKTITGEIIADDYTIVDVGKTSAYTIVARDFTVNTSVAANITDTAHFIARAEVRVVKLIEATEDKTPVLVSNGGFQAMPGVYQLTFGVSGVDVSKLSVSVHGTVTDGAAPGLTSDAPIIIPVMPAGTPDITRDQLINVGHIVAVDTEAVDPVNNPTGAITDYVQLVDTRTQQDPSIPADQPGVYQVLVAVTDADGNHVEREVAVVVDDGTFVYGAGFVLRAHDFDIDLRDVTVARAIEQIREQAEIQAWRNDGALVAASVIDTGGYRDAPGNYHPIVGIYDPTNPAVPMTILNDAPLSKPIIAKVIDTYLRSQVTFNPNGGVLVGPRVVTIVEPQVTLPYMPVAPTRDGYTFRYWSTTLSGELQFSVDTRLDGDITLYAIWDEIPPVVTAPPQEPPRVVINPPATVVSGGTTYVRVESGSNTEGDTLGDWGTPLYPERPAEIVSPRVAEEAPGAGWALLNLLATILSLLLLIGFLIRFFFDRPRDEQYRETPIDADVLDRMTTRQRTRYEARRRANYQAWLDDRYHRESRSRIVAVNLPVLLIVATSLVEALVVLLMTQTFTAAMTIVDDYSVIFILVVFVQVLTPLVAAILRSNRRESRQLATHSAAL
jgi:uncharacterized repeat protein (TIGR02543 family)